MAVFIACWIASLCCRRLNDAGVNYKNLLFLLIPYFGAAWVACLLLRPSSHSGKATLTSSLAFKRRFSNSSISLLFVFICPLLSIFFGLRRRSMEIALMPLATTGFVVYLSVAINEWLGAVPHNLLIYSLSGLASAFAYQAFSGIVRKSSQRLFDSLSDEYKSRLNINGLN